jgi:hypothetical protein
MRVVSVIRYEIDPFQREAFARYATTWGTVIPKCGGDLLGYFLPSQGTTYVAYALVAFESLAAYEAFQTRIRADEEGKANFEFARQSRCILKEERWFLEAVPGTMRDRAGAARPLRRPPAVTLTCSSSAASASGKRCGASGRPRTPWDGRSFPASGPTPSSTAGGAEVTHSSAGSSPVRPSRCSATRRVAPIEPRRLAVERVADDARADR